MTVTSVVFDLDGTLVDSSPDIAAALNRAFSELQLRPLTEPEVLAMLGGGPRVLVAKALEELGYTPSETELDAVLERYSAEYRAKPSERTVFFADAADALPQLRERGLMLGVCTNKRTDIAEQVLEHLGVRDLFGAVIGSDLASSPKPDAAHLTETLDALGADTAGCLYVGDTEIDALTAKSAGVRYAHVDWGHQIDAPVAVQIREFSELLLHIDD